MTYREPRLLPWVTEDGGPCYLISGEGGGFVSRMADAREAELLTAGADTLGEALEVLEDPLSHYTEVRYAGMQLARSVHAVLRVAESRGMRLPGREG
ncbi:hypothetical protein SRB5_45390 [Streptomyces sp. RB5]|uniref:Uncharacterized protein n=1 Tax=Streptomyces smaragdinus TaxID=2585196 RepID=A0A7K0CM77_9ACTN|nr:hypothetical protein [Streptomyces smaragdinus]MQY14373.1 hypothetical protein [Streptomyces smaragdinus]